MSIPASEIVQVNPGVVGTGGNSLSLNGLLLTKSTLLPAGKATSFGSADAVADIFGTSSDEYKFASVYFLGFDNSTKKPGSLYLSPYSAAARAGWMRTGSFAGANLSVIQGLAGVLTLTVDGSALTSSAISLVAATSFSNAATLITAGFTGNKVTCTWEPISSSFVFTSATTGASSSVSYATGTLAASLKATAATGAVTSAGTTTDTATTAMQTAVGSTQNWVSFTTAWKPTTDDMISFCEWANGKNQRYVYIGWDNTAEGATQGSTTAFGVVATAAAYDAAMPLYGPIDKAAFVMGMVASIDFTQTNGRITANAKSQSGLTADVTDMQIGRNLLENGYSFYGTYATANDTFTFLRGGSVTGKWKWLDAFADQVYLNSQLQLALVDLLASVKSIPYNEEGYNLIRSAMTDPIQSMINFGGIRKGISLSNSQVAQVNQAAGKDIKAILESQGFYLQILDPGAQVRGNRGTPVINLWYTDGGAVHTISLASIDVM
jgi:hypothetical protein